MQPLRDRWPDPIPVPEGGWWSVTCPDCQAPPGVPCRSLAASRYVRANTHSRRVYLVEGDGDD